MNKNIIWGLVLIAIGVALFITTAGDNSRAMPAGIITTVFGVIRIVRGLASSPQS